MTPNFGAFHAPKFGICGGAWGTKIHDGMDFFRMKFRHRTPLRRQATLFVRGVYRKQSQSSKWAVIPRWLNQVAMACRWGSISCPRSCEKAPQVSMAARNIDAYVRGDRNLVNRLFVAVAVVRSHREGASRQHHHLRALVAVPERLGRRQLGRHFLWRRIFPRPRRS
jgi:hypothetical protein